MTDPLEESSRKEEEGEKKVPPRCSWQIPDELTGAPHEQLSWPATRTAERLSWLLHGHSSRPLLNRPNLSTRTPVPTSKSDRYFFTGFALYYLATMIVGFSYSTSEILRQDGGLRTLAIVHAAFGTVWLLLFVAQTLLIDLRKHKLHMRLGLAGLPIMIGVFLTSVPAVLRPHLPAEDFPRQLAVSEVGLFSLGVVFTVLGLVYRRSAPAHKRFMLMSMIMLSPAGVARFMMFLGHDQEAVVGFVLVIFAIPLVAMVAFDLFVYRKVFLSTAASWVLYALTMAVGGFWGAWVVDTVRPLLV